MSRDLATVLYGINNIFFVESRGKTFECRIKGKVLKDTDQAYNPLSPGDKVTFAMNHHNPGKGMILARHERINGFVRWNKKKNAPQTIASNIDGIFCVSSPESPPFRPRFIDRVFIAAQASSIPVGLIVNKCDLSISDEALLRIRNFEQNGYPVFFTSVKTGEGILSLKSEMNGKTVALIGQSGVGKSSLLNALFPDLDLKVGGISKKYNRGTHTTCYALLLPINESTAIIDTPGIREIDPVIPAPSHLAQYFPEFRPYLEKCSFPSCLHTKEIGCGVKDGVKEGAIHPDRFESYLRILEEIKSRSRYCYA